MKYKVFIEDLLEICSVAQLLFTRTPEFLINTQNFDKFTQSFDNPKDAINFVTNFLSDIDEEIFREDWTIFVVVVDDKEIINIHQYNHRLELVEELF